MTYDPLKHHRRSIRLQHYDYTWSGAYFITVVAQERACLFGALADGVMRLSAAGQMVQSVWNELPAHYPGVDVDAFVVMPNHIHGIVVLTGPDNDNRPADNGVGAAPSGRPGIDAATATNAQVHSQPPGQAQWPAPTVTVTRLLSLPDVVHRFKTLTTTRFIVGVNQLGWLGFRNRVWQRNYYEEVIRDDAALARIRRYFAENPLGWEQDEENPWRPEH